MLSKAIPILLVCACTSRSTVSEPDEAVVTCESESDGNQCEPRNYPCTPNNPWGAMVCDAIYLGNGYCAPYSVVEDTWCARYPGQFFHGNPLRLCDALGNPTWQTHCVPGWLP